METARRAFGRAILDETAVAKISRRLLEAARRAFGRAILDETAVAKISRRLLETARRAFGRAILETGGRMRHIPRKRFGQHFLADPAILDRIVAAINPGADDSFVEIGPGEGVLTARMLGAVPSMHAVEIDRDLAAGLRRKFGGERLVLIEGDALALDFSTLPAGLRVIGNLPYNISTALMFHLCSFAGRFVDMHFMLQKEVVERMAAAASTPEYGRLSVMTQYWFEVRPLFRVPASAFRPPPKVESMVVRLIPRQAHLRGLADAALLKRVVTAAFSHRRKTLRNALAGLLTESILIELGVSPGARAENLSLDDYVRLAKHIQGNVDSDPRPVL